MTQGVATNLTKPVVGGGIGDISADSIVTPCPLCQANVEIQQIEINRRRGT